MLYPHLEEPLYCNPRNNISEVPYITVAQVTSPCRVNTKLSLTMASQSRDLSSPRPNGHKVRLPRTPYRTSLNRYTDPRATRITWQLGKSRSARLLSRPCSAPLSLTPRICDRHLRHSYNRYCCLVPRDGYNTSPTRYK